jgi:prepilin signal peptidase PulO-like enzyme (type II secretory pathway)
MEVSSRYLYLLVSIGLLNLVLVVFAGLIAPIIFGFFTEGPGIIDYFIPILIFLPFWLIYFAGKCVEKPMIGEADPYVFTALGIFFGVQFSISLFLYSVWVGSVGGIGYLYFVNRKFERNVRIPFLPIIFIAALIILITNFHIIKIQDILIINEILFAN